MIRTPIIVNTIGTNGKSADDLHCGSVELDPSSPGKITDSNLFSIFLCIMRLLRVHHKFSKSRYSDLE